MANGELDHESKIHDFVGDKKSRGENMEENVDLLAKMQAEYRSFSKGQKRISDYICENYDKAVDLTAARLGNTVGVSESTVVRFATEMGYKGYPQFQKALQEIVKNKLNSIQRMHLTLNRIDETKILETVLHEERINIKRTAEEIDEEEFNRAVDMICQARRIYIIGGRSCTALTTFLDFYLKYIFDDVRLISTESVTASFEEVHRISSEDVIIGISFPRYSVRTARTLEFSKGRGAKVVAITDSNQSPLTRVSDCHLYAKSNMVSIVDSLVAPLSLINALIAALSIRNKEQVLKTMDTLEHIWDEFNVYKEGNDQE